MSTDEKEHTDRTSPDSSPKIPKLEKDSASHVNVGVTTSTSSSSNSNVNPHVQTKRPPVLQPTKSKQLASIFYYMVLDDGSHAITSNVKNQTVSTPSAH